MKNTNNIHEDKLKLTSKFIDAIMNKNKKDADLALEAMVNNHISAKIKKVAQSEHLI